MRPLHKLRFKWNDFKERYALCREVWAQPLHFAEIHENYTKYFYDIEQEVRKQHIKLENVVEAVRIYGKLPYCFEEDEIEKYTDMVNHCFEVDDWAARLNPDTDYKANDDLIDKVDGEYYLLHVNNGVDKLQTALAGAIGDWLQEDLESLVQDQAVSLNDISEM